MSIPKEPRQLMINLMYLVLTALLALNVSAEILNAFKIVNNSIVKSNENISNKCTTTMQNFAAALDDDKVKANPKKMEKIQSGLDQANKAQEMVKVMQASLDAYIKKIEDAAGGYIEDHGVRKLSKEDDTEGPNRIMIEEKEGMKLKSELEKFKQDLVALLPDSIDADRTKFDKDLPLYIDEYKGEGGSVVDWAYGNFHSVPAIAAITILNKYKNDVQNSESILLDKLYSLAMQEKAAKQLVFDSYAPLVAAESGYVMQGQTYEAKIMLGAFSKNVKNMSVNAGGSSLPVVDGIAIYKANASGLGEKSFSVSVSFDDPNTGKTETYKTEAKYMVGAPAAAVSADKMNVFYIGVDNPVSVSASGVPPSSVNASIAGGGGSMSPGGNKGQYTVRVSTPTPKDAPAFISVSAEVDGKQVNMGKFPFRVRKIPDPVPKVGTKSGGGMKTGEWKGQGGVMAILENFEFDARFDVLSFTLGYTPKRGDYTESVVVGARWGSSQPLIDRAKPGDQYYIDNIKAKGPDGSVRTLPTISFKIM